MRELFINCTSGAAGDMLAGALLELFPDGEKMISRLNDLAIPGVEFSAKRMTKHGVTGTRLAVKYCGTEEEQGMFKQHRSVLDIGGIVKGLNMSDELKSEVMEVYRSIAAAESEAHGCEVEQVHFHELGAMDAIADICAVCFLADALGAEHIRSTPICTGFGEISCAHGVLPIPAPATAALLRDIPSFSGDIEGELCTPTGAALIKHLARDYGQAREMTVKAVGCGMGKKDFSKLSAVRISIGDSEERIIELCCNVDDMSPEAVGFAIDELLRHGAADAYYEQIGMKKNRPGLILSCLCRESERDEMVRLIFRHTSTIGIRETVCRRYMLKRREELVTTPYGDVRIKLSEGYGIKRKKAEYDDLAEIARREDISLDEIKKLAEQ